MSGPLVSASAAFVAKNSRIPPFAIEQSLRFDGSSYLSLGTGTTHTTTNYTISFWFKMNKPNSGAGGVTIFNTMGNNNTETCIKNAYDWNAIGTDKLGSYWHQTNSGNNYGGGSTLAVYRDPSAWYHVVVAIDTTQSAAADRCKYFVNGVLQELDSGSLGIPIPQNYSPVFRNFEHRIGQDAEWYLAEYHLTTDGTKAATDFGEYDNNGVWRPIEYTGNYGTFGFYLKFDPSATNGIGHDHSDNGLHWTANSFTTSGTGTDVMSDTPTTNWCTLNSLQQSNDTTLSDGNLRFAGSVSKGMICGTQGATSGKYYWEFIVDDSGQDMSAGLTNLDETVLNLVGDSAPGRNTWSWGLYMYPLNTYIRKVHNTVYTDTSATKVSNGDVIGIAYDAGAGKMWASKNNTWMDSGDPAAGTNALFTNLSGTIAPAVMPPGGGVSTTNTANFGQRAFAYTPPTGFSALNTKNLPAPDIKDGSDYFNTVTYTGNGTSQSISSLDFSPDFVWLKCRSIAYNHRLVDSVQGVESTLSSNLINAAVDSSSEFTSLDSNGFSITNGAGYEFNNNAVPYVAWNWLAANGTTSNTDGSITSTVSANPTAGFSIVSYTGTGSAATIGHGLNAKPVLNIIKRTAATTDWVVYTDIVDGSWDYLLLSKTDAKANSSVFSAGTSTFNFSAAATVANVSGSTAIAYCFAEVEGYSKFGSYTGNGSSTDGPFVWCGFRPAFFMVKRTDAAGSSWIIHDTARDTYNKSDKILQPNQNTAEVTNNSLYDIDIISNGIKLRNNSAAWNVSSATYIFAAFAENPFGGSGVSPATAR